MLYVKPYILFSKDVVYSIMAQYATLHSNEKMSMFISLQLNIHHIELNIYIFVDMMQCRWLRHHWINFIFWNYNRGFHIKCFYGFSLEASPSSFFLEEQRINSQKKVRIVIFFLLHKVFDYDKCFQLSLMFVSSLGFYLMGYHSNLTIKQGIL